ncbi:hypothetical protein PM082_001524 [Marasmius tenuissimus]|nr:hypothetical protein PM082_001524 [Marasmius tenuissimus]
MNTQTSTPVPLEPTPASALAASPSPNLAVSLPPRPYEQADLHGLNKTQIASLVLRQIDFWPASQGKRVTSTTIKRDTNKDALIAGLLDKDNGFTTCEPRQSPYSPSTPQSNLTLNAPNSPATEPVPPPVAPESGITALTVFVRDSRSVGKSRGQVANIRVPCVLGTSLPVLPLFVSAKDVMRELQKTNAAIRGCKTVTVSQQHSQFAEYEVTFATAFDPADVEKTVYSPEMLDFPPRGHLFLDVDDRPEVGAGRVSLVALALIFCQDSDEPDPVKPSSSIQGPREPSNTNRTVAKARTEVVDWLQRELHNRPGYEEFKVTRHHALQNPEIVNRWRFMAEFANEYKRSDLILHWSAFFRITFANNIHLPFDRSRGFLRWKNLLGPWDSPPRPR